MTKLTCSQYYNQKEAWQGINRDPYFREKSRLIMSMIPENVETIVDIGCGDGSITNELSFRYRVVGLDYAIIPLQMVKGLRILANVASLPLRDKSYDLVLCSELIEHLDPRTFEHAILEINRVSKRYILISVPFREYLRSQFIKCPHCGLIFHIYHHLRSFNLQSLSKYFHNYFVRLWCHCGHYNSNYNHLLLTIRQTIGHKWYDDYVKYPMCPRCHNTNFSSNDRTFFRKGITYLCNKLNKKISSLKPKAEIPYWIIVLFERKGNRY